MMSVSDLSFSYGREPLFSNVSFDLDRPELVCILGPNGVGKTTLVKCLNKLLRPTGGKITLDGEDVSGMGLMDVARKMAFVPNHVTMTFRTSVSEAVLMGRFPHAQWSTSDEDLDIVDSVLSCMKLQELAGKDISELSSGQLQRVMIARGLAQQPEILILDEPTSNLDVKNQMDVMRFLKDYARENGIVVLMVCHDLNITAAFADRIIMMSNGGILADDTPGRVMCEENISAVYGVRSRVIDVEGSPHVILLPEA